MKKNKLVNFTLSNKPEVAWEMANIRMQEILADSPIGKGIEISFAITFDPSKAKKLIEFLQEKKIGRFFHGNTRYKICFHDILPDENKFGYGPQVMALQAFAEELERYGMGDDRIEYSGGVAFV